MSPLPGGVTYGEWSAVYNALSFGIAAMGSATIFFWIETGNVHKKFRTALCITGLVTAIATYHYVRIFNSWNESYAVSAGVNGSAYEVSLTGAPFNDAYRYVDWLLTVPLLLIELILVMGLPAEQTASLSWQMGLASAVMVALGYPGEVQDDLTQRWLWWALAMVPFAFVVEKLLIGLGEATESQPEEARGLIGKARILTAVSWLTYPFVYIIKSVGIAGATAQCAEQIGYSVADVVAKAVFGVLIWGIARAKSDVLEREAPKSLA
jgi:bacteriorhodopsin